MRLFIGIDPGQTGGLGIIDQDGHYFASKRWNRRDPRQLYILLQSINDLVVLVYLEDVNLPPDDGLGNRFSSSSNLMVNSGIWQGWLIALGHQVVLVRPTSWQAAVGLFNWKKRQQKNEPVESPLVLARRLYPEAPLEFQADDGQAVGLLLASLAYQDAQNGIDRAAMQQLVQQKKQKARQEGRKLAKATRTLPGITGDAEHGFF